jgi:hypothetical protein
VNFNIEGNGQRRLTVKEAHAPSTPSSLRHKRQTNIPADVAKMGKLLKTVFVFSISQVVKGPQIPSTYKGRGKGAKITHVYVVVTNSENFYVTNHDVHR